VSSYSKFDASVNKSSTSILLAFKSRAVCVAVDIILLRSLVLSTLDKPTCVFVTECGFPISFL